jgi:hypothetical protein
VGPGEGGGQAVKCGPPPGLLNWPGEEGVGGGGGAAIWPEIYAP